MRFFLCSNFADSFIIFFRFVCWSFSIYLYLYLDGAVEARTFHTRYRIKEPQAEMTNEYIHDYMDKHENLCSNVQPKKTLVQIVDEVQPNTKLIS